MSGLLRNVVAAGAALMMMAGPAMAAKEIGIYQTTDRKMDFQLLTCGNGDTELCVVLKDARDTARTWQVEPYIGKLVVNRAKPTGNNLWKGTMKFGQYSVSGKMTLRPGESFVVSGCAMFVVCNDFNLIPAK